MGERSSPRGWAAAVLGSLTIRCSARCRFAARPLAMLALASPARGTIAEDVDDLLGRSPLVLYGQSSEEARAVVADLEIEGTPARMAAAAGVTDADLAGSDLLVFGTPETNPLVARCLAGTPFRLTASSVTVGDSTYQGTDVRLVASLVHPVDPQRKCIVYAVQDEELLSGIFFGYGASYVAADFLVYRKSDGLYYRDDRLAYGSLVKGQGSRAAR